MFAVAQRAIRFRGLLVTLTQRELQARYRGSALGFLWSLVNPLLLTAVYSLVFGYVLSSGGRGFGIEPYAVFLISGLFPWLWISGSLLEGTASLVSNGALIRKAVFPIELPPLVAVLANLIHFCLALPILAGTLLVSRFLGFEVGGWGVLLLPLIVIIQFPMISGITLALSALNVLFKDVRDLVQNGLTLIFFLAPIIYPLEGIPASFVTTVVRFNPFTPFILACQAVLFEGRVPALEIWVQMVVLSGLSWIAGAWLFERLRSTLVEMA